MGKNLKEFAKYEKQYDKNDIILFNSYCLKSDDVIEKEKGILSNLYSDCSIYIEPQFKDVLYTNHKFHSSEQLLFFFNFLKWGEYIEDVPSVVSRISFLLNLKNAKQVKGNPRTHFFYEKILSWKKKNLGWENAYFDEWKNQYLAIRMKYKCCKEFREVLDKYKDKVLCEDSYWGDNFNGVLWDESIGKFRGVNALGRVMKRVYLERNEIMGE